jgi:ferredoxin
MKVRVDKETSGGDETWVEVSPEGFEMEGDVAVAKMENVPKDLEKKVKEAATSCLVEAIILESWGLLSFQGIRPGLNPQDSYGEE